jgi:hypothetical protein
MKTTQPSITMALLRNQQKSLQASSAVQVYRDVPQTPSVPVMEFDTERGHYGISLDDIKAVTKDLMTVLSGDRHSVAGRFLTLNRRNTIVFNLHECLSIVGEKMTERDNTSFLMLDERVGDCCIGVIVPGIPSVIGRECPKVRPAKKFTGVQKKYPAWVERRLTRRSGKKQGEYLSLINLRDLVDQSIVHMKLEGLQESPVPIPA